MPEVSFRVLMTSVDMGGVQPSFKWAIKGQISKGRGRDSMHGLFHALVLIVPDGWAACRATLTEASSCMSLTAQCDSTPRHHIYGFTIKEVGLLLAMQGHG